MTSRSPWQLSQLATCASTCRLAFSFSDPCRRSGSISWISVSMHLFIFQKLLYRPDRVVIVNPCRALGTTNDFRNLLVRQSLLNPQREHFPLRRRQCIERFSDTLLRFFRDQTVERSVFTDMIRLLHRNRFPAPPLRSPSIEHQPPLDREQPRSERALTAKRIERCKRPHERVLHQLLDTLPLASARGKASQRLRMAPHQVRRRPAVAGLPAVDQLHVGFVWPIFGAWRHGASSGRRSLTATVKAD